ncbi:hypothetical protein BCR43DRAFT_501804 [Syncephalastrum racemosum]|uniref:De-etiolated protein 1 Det1-domain-containing protein n=1 Tax=Syncephalastrum racemosum TaxID=13706 RepID=A0A1X2HKP5_SYNRA|nr:hypothetical protein BCR43DRAFT_501804 [Syncephalastrum racemosum]
MLASNTYMSSKHKTISSVIKQRSLGLSHPARAAREISTCVAPNCTLYNVVVPPDAYLVRFSPDGQYLLAITADSLAIRVYAFRDSVDLIDSLANQTAFSQCFRLVYEKTMPKGARSYRLERRFCIFTGDSSHMLLVSEHKRDNVDQHQDIGDIWHCQDYKFYLVNVETGGICDTLIFDADYLELLENVCASLFNDLLAIVSLGHEYITGFRLHVRK